jgi:prevent-host-death family protein
MSHQVPLTQARAELADLVNKVAYGGERVVLTRHGKPLAAIVSAGDFAILEQAGTTTPPPLVGGQPLGDVPAQRPLSTSQGRSDIAAAHDR